MSMPHSPLVTQRTINAIRRVLAVLVVIATVTALNNQWEYAANPPYKGVFPYGTGDNVGSINSISVQVDAAGGMHAAYAGYYTGLVGDIDTKSGYYSYCAPTADCSKTANWQRVVVSNDSVQEVQLALTPDGKPRMLLLSTDNDYHQYYFYAECNANCLNANSWTSVAVGYDSSIAMKIWDTSNHYFTLDAQGHPRFVFGSGEIIYAYCDNDCTTPTPAPDPTIGLPVGANWNWTHMYSGLYLNTPSISITPDGKPRIAGNGYQDMNFTFDYFECNTNCDDSNNWSRMTLDKAGSTPSMSMKLDHLGRPRWAIYNNSTLYYAYCNSDCSNPGNWGAMNVGAAVGDGQDPDIAFDSQNRPRISFAAASDRAKAPGLGWGLGLTWCDTNCESQNGQWQRTLVEDAGELNTIWPKVAPARCQNTGWWGGYRSSLVLDAAGNPIIGYDAEHEYACYEYYPPKFGSDSKSVRIVYLPDGATGTGGNGYANKVFVPVSIRSKPGGW